jgi:hypothetical protein
MVDPHAEQRESARDVDGGDAAGRPARLGHLEQRAASSAEGENFSVLSDSKGLQGGKFSSSPESGSNCASLQAPCGRHAAPSAREFPRARHELFSGFSQKYTVIKFSSNKLTIP